MFSIIADWWCIPRPDHDVFSGLQKAARVMLGRIHGCCLLSCSETWLKTCFCSHVSLATFTWHSWVTVWLFWNSARPRARLCHFRASVQMVLNSSRHIYLEQLCLLQPPGCSSVLRFHLSAYILSYFFSFFKKGKARSKPAHPWSCCKDTFICKLFTTFWFLGFNFVNIHQLCDSAVFILQDNLGKSGFLICTDATWIIETINTKDKSMSIFRIRHIKLNMWEKKQSEKRIFSLSLKMFYSI